MVFQRKWFVFVGEICKTNSRHTLGVLVVFGDEMVEPDEDIVCGRLNQGLNKGSDVLSEGLGGHHIAGTVIFRVHQSLAVTRPVVTIHIADRHALVDSLFRAVCSVVVPIAALSAVKPSVSLVAHARAVEVLNGPAFPHVRLSSVVLRLRDSDLLAGASAAICAALGRAGDARNGATRTRRQTLRGSAGQRNDGANFYCCMEHSKNQYHH